MEGTPLPSPEGLLSTLSWPSWIRWTRACMDADLLLSLPEASPVFPWPQDTVPPFPLLPRLASSFSFASSAPPNYSASKQWGCQGFSSNSMFCCQYFISRRCLILTDQNFWAQVSKINLTPGFSKLQICTRHWWLKPPLGKLSDSFTCWK